MSFVKIFLSSTCYLDSSITMLNVKDTNLHLEANLEHLTYEKILKTNVQFHKLIARSKL